MENAAGIGHWGPGCRMFGGRNFSWTLKYPDLFTSSLPILTPSHNPAPYQTSFPIRRLRDSFLSASNRSLLLLLPFQLEMIRQLLLGERPQSILEETLVV